MNIRAINFAAGVSELDEAGLQTLPSIRIRPPRIAGSPVAMECELMQIVPLGTEMKLVLGRVAAMHIREDAVVDPADPHVDASTLRLIARMHSPLYARTSYARTSDLFRMDRISREDWVSRGQRLSPEVAD